MPSPFPGMNPYLEQADIWEDFHQSFLPAMREELARQVDPGYFVKIEERLYVHELPPEPRRLLGRGDVALTQGSGERPQNGTTAVLDAPIDIQLVDVDFERSSFLEIRDRRRRQVVTVVELLSPTNKRPGPDRQQYLSKRRELIQRGVNLVEIDLLRGGPRMPMDGLPDCDYCVMVSRPETWPRASAWPIPLRQRLPVIPIPLRAPDPDARLDLQELLHRIYDAARYRTYLYETAPEPPLVGEAEAWVRTFLPAV